MYKKLLTFVTALGLLITSTFAEGDISDLFTKGSSNYSIGQKFDISRWSLSNEGETYASENCFDLRFDYTYYFANNHGLYAELEYDRETHKPKNSDNNVYLDKSLELGYEGILPINRRLAALGRVGFALGLDREKSTQYNYETNMNERFTNDGTLSGFSLATGVHYQPFEGSSLLVSGLAEYERTSINWDNSKLVSSVFCIETNIKAAIMSCEEYFCKMDDDAELPVFTQNRHQQGNWSIDMNRLPYFGFGTEIRTSGIGTDYEFEQKYNINMAGFNASADYFIADNIAVGGGVFLNSNGSENKENETSTSNSDYRLEIGGRYYPFEKGFLSNFSGYADVEVGQTKTETVSIGSTYRFGDNLIGISVGIDFEQPISEETAIYGRAGFMHNRASSTESDYKESRNAVEAEFGVRITPRWSF